jgi:hypothetical protein
VAPRGPLLLNEALKVWIPQSTGNFLTNVGVMEIMDNLFPPVASINFLSTRLLLLPQFVAHIVNFVLVLPVSLYCPFLLVLIGRRLQCV